MKTKILIGAIILISLGVGGFFAWQNISQPGQSGKGAGEISPPSEEPEQFLEEPSTGGQEIPSSFTPHGSSFEGSVSIEATGSKYKTVMQKPTSGWFQTGQDADLMLSGIDFNNAGGPLLFNHPGTVASDGTHLLLADRNNNRVLIWNRLPTSNTPPDLVLGQKDFYSNDPGTGLDEMNWPLSISAAGGKVVVTDTNNNRILIWNTFPSKNGQPADFVLNNAARFKDDNPKRNIIWPWGVWTNGKKLAVSSTQGGLVLLWNNFPTENDQPADLYLKGQGNMGTPRTITSDGEHLIVGDHNSKVMLGLPGSGNFFWKSWPTKDNEPYDFFMQDPSDPRGVWMQGDFSDGKLMMFGTNLHIWNSFPESANDKPDFSVGSSKRGDFSHSGGDGSGIAIAGGKLYISLNNGNRIVVFNSLPTKVSDEPDFAIGSPDIYTNTLDINFIISNPVPATDGKSLFVSSDFDRKLYVYKNLPDESNAHPDFVYSLPEAPWDNELYGDALALAGKKSVYIWKTLPRNGEKQDIVFQNSIGSVSFQNLQGVTLDNKYFYLADTDANKIYVWEGIPSKSSNPKFTITTDQPTRLSSDGKYLVVAATLSGPGGSIRIYRIDSLSSQSQPVTLGGVGKFNLPQGALAANGHLFVGDTGFNRVLIWKNIEDAIAGKDADVILGNPEKSSSDPNTFVPQIGKNKLFWPANLAFDGSFLWVGEFKFSERLLRFSVK